MSARDPREVRASEILDETLLIEEVVGQGSMVVMSALQNIAALAHNNGMEVDEIGQGSFVHTVLFHVANSRDGQTAEQHADWLRSEFERILPAAIRFGQAIRVTAQARERQAEGIKPN